MVGGWQYSMHFSDNNFGVEMLEFNYLGNENSKQLEECCD